VNSILGKIKSSFGSHPGARPPVAVELSPQGVLAAASLGAGHAPVYAFQPLAADALAPSIGEPNLRAPEAVAQAIRTAIDQVSPRARAVTLVIPDAAVRVFVLDFDDLPSRAAEAVSILRFRLRKALPFDVEQAGVSYQILTESKAGCRVLVAVIPGSILQEYESVARQAGYEPGAVLSTSLAALAVIDSAEPVLAANLGAMSLTTAITHGHDLLLYRTLDLPENPELRLQVVQRDIAVAAAYYEDKLGAAPKLLYYVGIGEEGVSAVEGFARWIDAPPELKVVDLAPRPETGATTPLGNLLSLAGVLGALAETAS
jgi:type IV pilus assembly protein PilM